MRPATALLQGGSHASRLSILWIWLLVVAAIWVACSADSEDQLDEELIELGRIAYLRDCQVCHGDVRTGAGATDNSPAHGRTGHTWHHADGQLKQIILGTLDYEGKTMPSFEGKLTERELDGLLEYMKAGWDGEQRAWQAEASKNWLESQGGGH